MIEFKNISKYYGPVQVLHDISFSIGKASVIALAGENGAGKSTLSKILSGVITDYEGEIRINDKPVRFDDTKDAENNGIVIIHQELNIVPDLSVAENIYLGREPKSRLGFVNKKEMIERADILLQEFDFPFSSTMLMRNISVGWQQITEIARALDMDATVIIMDEPTSALSEQEINTLLEKIKLLREQGKSVIFISHRLKEMYEIADEIVILRDGRYIGTFITSETSRETLISNMIGKAVSESNELNENRINSDKNILSMDNVSVVTDGRKILSDISFDLRKGEVLGIAGLLGAGRTALLKFLFGEIRSRFTGTIELEGDTFIPASSTNSLKKKIIYLSENRKTEGIFPNESVLFNASISVLPSFTQNMMISSGTEREEVAKSCDMVDVRMQTMKQPINTLSGGNQQKVLLSRVLMIDPILLLLDEPTRGIDVGAKQEIYSLISTLRKQGKSFIISSSEIPELLSVCDRILVLSQGKQTALLKTTNTTSQEILHHAFAKH